MKKIKRNDSSQFQQNNGVAKCELTVDSSFVHPTEINHQETYLKNITNNPPVTFLRRIEEVESQTVEETHISDKSISPESSIRKVRVTGWNNSLQTPHYI